MAALFLKNDYNLYFQHLSQRFEPKASDEENTTGLKITPDMTPSDVTHAILEDFNKK